METSAFEIEACTLEVEALDDLASLTIPQIFHSSFNHVYKKLKKWRARFPFSSDNTILSDLFLFYFLATKSFLEHRSSIHLFRLVLSIHNIQKKLLRAATFASHLRHLEIRWIPTNLVFPFSSKPVLGCLIGFNLMDRCEVFDEENVLLALQKHLPELTLVKESSYLHASQYKNLKIFYLEIEKKNFSAFTTSEQNILKTNLEDKVRNSIQTLSPNIFIRQNNEELYKNILVLSQEIHSPKDLPQAHITLDQHTGKEIVFRVILVHISPSCNFPLKERFEDCDFILQRDLTVRHLENHPIKAQIFSIQLSRNPSLLRSDGSLDFYSARQKVVNLIKSAIGEFRDYNGGILIKQQELLQALKINFPEVNSHDPELIETFFYELIPLEKQVILSKEILTEMFSCFQKQRKEKLNFNDLYSLKIVQQDLYIFISIKSKESFLIKIISEFIQKYLSDTRDIAYNFIKIPEGTFFNCALLRSDSSTTQLFIQFLDESLQSWGVKKRDQRNLRIGLQHSLVSLDPRIGGESISNDVLRLLFEGLTRINQTGNVENALAESIQVTSDGKEYFFKLRKSFWNDGSPVTAYDFEYAWKKVLSPEFKTSFASFFYNIKNAKKAKEGKVLPHEIGITVIDDHQLKVALEYPTPYFLQLTAYSLFSPIHRSIDKKQPQWPYQGMQNYPCNGSFQLKINQPNQGYQLVKNPFYWESNRITLDQITLTKMNPAQAFQAFQKNELDWVGNPFGSWHSFYTPGPDDHVITLSRWMCWFVFNTLLPPFNNIKLRQAFSYAIERAQIVANPFFSLIPAYSVLPLQNRQNPRPLFPDCDQEKAKQLFEEALKELNMNRDSFPVINLTYHDKGVREFTSACLKQQFSDCFGIKCKLIPLSWNSLFPKMTTGDFHMGLVEWTSWVDDPIYTLNVFRTAQQEINFSKWENPEFYRLLQLSDYEINLFKRSSYLLQAEEILRREMPVIPLFNLQSKTLVKKGIEITQGSFYNISKSYKKREI